MLKKILLIIAVIFSTTNILALEAPEVVWKKQYPTSGLSYGKDVVQTDDGGFIAVGYESIFRRDV